MAKYLIIVESPAKVKTIKRFLGSNYDVEASGGHVRDLPKSTMGIDLDNDFEPHYITIRGKGDVLSNLRKKAKKAEKVYLATDPDREGEAIAWHLKAALGVPEEKICRISFNEITKTAVKNSIKNARPIDMDLVDAQQGRRVLDRVTGYSISPLLWKKVKRGLSAGRVQSSTLKIVCDREAEIAGFVPEDYWSLAVSLTVDGGKKQLHLSYDGKEGAIRSEEEMQALIDAVKDSSFSVREIKVTPKRKKAPQPFTTSTMQQEASRTLNFSPQKTMRIAQQLYEGVDVPGKGTIGLITYLRTDSTRISAEAHEAAIEYIRTNYGERYVPESAAAEKRDGKIQDAHEAIRPASLDVTLSELKDTLSRDQFRLYQMIWKRFLASRMEDYCYNSTKVTVTAGRYGFSATMRTQTFDGFHLIYNPDDEKATKDKVLETIREDTQLADPTFEPEQHFTQPPAHYTEAAIVKTMEECGIGRPSTYAPTITTLLARHYLIKEGKNLYVTELGEVVNELCEKSFPMITGKGFTALMESYLDRVAEGELPWKATMHEFYPQFKSALDKAMTELEKVTVADEVSDEVCELCGRNLVIKYGPHGKFLACPGFPECRNTKPFLEKTGICCPKCGGEILIRKTKKGRRYYGCENNPNCDYMSWQKPEKTDKNPLDSGVVTA